MNNIQKPSSTKIEQRSLNALESIIDKHKTMLYDFSKGDKEMSWDGFIWLFKFDNGNNSKNNAYSRVPVQIKGHDDTAEKFIHKEKITYPVDIADLNLYATEKGRYTSRLLIPIRIWCFCRAKRNYSWYYMHFNRNLNNCI